MYIFRKQGSILNLSVDLSTHVTSIHESREAVRRLNESNPRRDDRKTAVGQTKVGQRRRSLHWRHRALVLPRHRRPVEHWRYGGFARGIGISYPERLILSKSLKGLRAARILVWSSASIPAAVACRLDCDNSAS